MVKKSEPEEVSSKKKGKKPIPKRVNVQGQKRNVRDPRFDDLSGTLNETMFEKSYGFLSEMRQNEVKKIRKALRKEKRPSQKADLHKLLQRMEQEDARKQEAVERKKKENANNRQARHVIGFGTVMQYVMKQFDWLKRSTHRADCDGVYTQSVIDLSDYRLPTKMYPCKDEQS